MKVGFVILNYITFGDTIVAVNSLVIQLKKDHQARKFDIHIVVVDNNSPNDSQRKLQTYIGTLRNDSLEGQIDIQLLVAANNGGYGAGNNLGLVRLFQVTGCDVVFVINSDVIVQEIDLQELFEVLKSKGPLCLGGLLEQPTNVNNKRIVLGAIFSPWSFRSKNIYDAKALVGKKWFEVAYIAGAFMGMNAALFELTHGFWEGNFLYFEELDLFYRVREFSNRWPRLTILKKWVVRHDVGGSTGNSIDARKKSMIAEYYSSRARLLFARRHLTYFIPIALAYNAGLIANRIRHGNWKAVRKILEGSIDGIRKIGGKKIQLHRDELRS